MRPKTELWNELSGQRVRQLDQRENAHLKFLLKIALQTLCKKNNTKIRSDDT